MASLDVLARWFSSRSQMLSISIVVPTFKEAENLPLLIPQDRDMRAVAGGCGK